MKQELEHVAVGQRDGSVVHHVIKRLHDKAKTDFALSRGSGDLRQEGVKS